MLLGVTRSLVLEVAEGLLRVERRAVPSPSCHRCRRPSSRASRARSCRSSRIDGRPVGDGRVGRTQALLEAFGDLVQGERFF